MDRVLLPLLALAAAAAADDPFEEQFRRFFKEEIAGKWAGEQISEQRVVMIRGFEKHDTPSAASWLLTDVLAKVDAGDVLREAVRILGTYKREVTVEEMVSVWERRLRKPASARALALLAFGVCKAPASDRPLERAFGERDTEVLVCLCKGIGLGRKFKFRAQLENLVKHKHRAVRGAALAALGDLGGDESLPVVFEAFCGDASPRVRYDAWTALTRLSLENFPCDPAAWREWWLKQKEALPEDQPNPWGETFPRVAGKGPPFGNFFGIPVLGEKVCFLLDVSGGMNTGWKIDHSAERAKPKETQIPKMFSVKTRWDLARAYVEQCLAGMPESTELGCVYFSDDVQTHPDPGRFVRNKGRGVNGFLDSMESAHVGGSTDIHKALATAWGWLKEGNPRLNLDRGFDTLVFLTDGNSAWGEFKDRPDRIRDEAWLVATLRNVRIHAVGLYNHDFALCAALARDSGGLYVHGQEHDDPAEPQDLDFWPEKKKAFEEARKRRKPG